jgi:hypothetical protein
VVELLGTLLSLRLREIAIWASLLAALVTAWRLLPSGASAVERGLGSRWAPLAAAGLSFAQFGWIWGSLSGLPLIHDEVAYVLQARIFASGHWTAPGRPPPEFFEQFHVFVTPVLASKYPPGHSLTLVPGVWLGLPGLVPLALTALAAGLLYALSRDVAGPWAAAAAWLLWTTNAGDLRFRPGYFSETTTVAAWLAGWWLLRRWLERNDPRSLLALALVVAWGAITRPVTMLAFGIPVAVVVLRRALARRRLLDLVPAAAAGLVVLLVVPLWNERTTGDWRVSPLALWSRAYAPFNMPGFHVDPTPPRFPMNFERRQFEAFFRPIFERHTPDRLPSITLERVRFIGRDMWGKGRAALLPFALLGLATAPAAAWPAIAGAALLVIFHLVLAHPPQWTIYYLEAQTVLAFLTALGLVRAVTFAAGLWRGRAGGRFAPEAIAAAVLVAALGPCVGRVEDARSLKADASLYLERFAARVARIPEPRAVVFVRYSERHPNQWSLVRNEPDLETARTWLVFDRGSENEKLLKLAPDRAPYLYDEASEALTRCLRGPADSLRCGS